MMFMIRCIDKPDSTDLRAANREAHLAYLKDFADAMFAAGPLLDDEGASPVGSLLLMELPDRKAAEEFARNDPYAKAGLFDSVEIRPWKKVLP